MEGEIFNSGFNEIFKWLNNDVSPTLLKFELDLYKKLWNFFVVGDAYYFILNHHNLTIEFVSKEIETVMGYLPGEFDIKLMNSKLHPEDHSWFLSIGSAIVNFFALLPIDKMMEYKIRYDIRFKKKNGEYARILYQGILLDHDEEGKFLRTLSMHTDITYLKKEGQPILSFIGMNGEPSYIDVGARNICIESDMTLTQRERDILKHVSKGKSSKEISDALHISKQTVDTHRKNMLHKKKVRSTGELIAQAILNGWI